MVTPAKKTSKCAAVWGRAKGASILLGRREQSRQRRKYDHGSGNDDYRNSSEERGEAETDAEFVRCAEGLRKLP